MFRRLTRTLLLFALLAIVPFSTQSASDEFLQAQQGIDLLMKRDYEKAVPFLNQVFQTSPDLLGLLGKMVFYQLRNFENYDFRFSRDYKPWGKKGHVVASEILKNPDSKSWTLFLSGGVFGVQAFHQGRSGKWWQAYLESQKALQALNQALEKDPNFLEPLFGIGLYEYWRSHYTERLWWLPFFPDRRAAGKEKLKRVIAEGSLVRPLAEIALAFIAFQEGRYGDLLVLTRSLLKRYPDNLVVRMLQARAEIAQRQYRLAVQDLEKILQEEPAIAKAHLFIGIALYREGKDWGKAEGHLRRYLGQEPDSPRQWEKVAEEILERI